MDIIELKNGLNDLKIPKHWYLINEGIKSDAHILEMSNNIWYYFYHDEKGNKRNERIFLNENDACHFFFEKMKKNKSYFD